MLFTRRTEQLSRHAGQVSFPGGRVDPGDAGAVEAALREADEEVGLGAGLVEPIGLLDPYLTVSGFRIVPVVGVAQPFRPRLDPAEVEEAFEVPLAALLEPGAFRRCSVPWCGRMRHYFEFHHGDHRIWGATAAIVINLRERLVAA
ncbi:MAG TPA: CoA pyrophosphatase [Xanthomonadaceae bacterium]|nr:CoA pyrophosphatase [Xanthomonadaceae bacterium]